MKIVSWNINGLRSMKKEVSTILAELDADIACFQETKITKEFMTEELALVKGYCSYYSYCKTRAGYSGTVTYCKRDLQAVHAADSLLTPLEGETELEFSLSVEELKLLDSEGRTVITQHRLKEPYEGKSWLSVVNLYCPCVTGDMEGRELFRVQFLQTLEERIRQLQTVSHVIVLGDLNISHRIIDHCDPGEKQAFLNQSHRQWLQRMLSDDCGTLIDSYRTLHPLTKFAYTCWDTKSNCRQTNFGVRIDYILLDRRIQGALVEAEVLAKYLGSDHCPVRATLNNLCITPSTSAPKLCSSHRYKAKQQKLTMFLTKGSSNTTKVRDPFDSFTPTTQSSRSTKQTNKKPTKKRNTSMASFLTTSIKRSKPETVDSSESGTSSQSTAENDSQTPSNSSPASQPGPKPTQNSNVEGWSKIFSKSQKVPKPPVCSGHSETCMLQTVKKVGENKGRQFYSCVRAKGPSADKLSRCSYFKWADDL